MRNLLQVAGRLLLMNRNANDTRLMKKLLGIPKYHSRNISKVFYKITYDFFQYLSPVI